MDAGSSGGETFFEEYQGILNKLKKRFLRKPNVSESAAEFGRLAERLAQAPLPEYAGLTQLARARCLETLAGRTGETDALLAAGRQFLLEELERAEQRTASDGGPLQAAVWLYSAAARRQLAAQRGLLAARTWLQLAHGLRRLGRPRQALLYFQDAAELQTPPASLESRQLAAQCQLEVVDLEGALATLDDMRASIEELGGSSSGHSATARYLRWCEVSQVLLLLAAEPPGGGRLLEALGRRRGGHLSEALHLLLQSLAAAVRRRQPAALRRLEGELWPLLDASQRQLLGRLVLQVESRAPARP